MGRLLRRFNQRRLAVAVCNTHPEEELACRIWVPGVTLGAQGTLRTLTGPTLKAYNDRDRPTDVRIAVSSLLSETDTCTLHLGPHSVSVITLNLDPDSAPASRPAG